MMHLPKLSKIKIELKPRLNERRRKQLSPKQRKKRMRQLIKRRRLRASWKLPLRLQQKATLQNKQAQKKLNIENQTVVKMKRRKSKLSKNLRSLNKKR
jgi:hypothetical protein